MHKERTNCYEGGGYYGQSKKVSSWLVQGQDGRGCKKMSARARHGIFQPIQYRRKQNLNKKQLNNIQTRYKISTSNSSWRKKWKIQITENKICREWKGPTEHPVRWMMVHLTGRWFMGHRCPQTCHVEISKPQQEDKALSQMGILSKCRLIQPFRQP